MSKNRAMVIELYKEDIEQTFADTPYEELIKKLDKNDMEYIADKIADSLMEMYWESLQIVVEHYMEGWEHR